MEDAALCAPSKRPCHVRGDRDHGDGGGSRRDHLVASALLTASDDDMDVALAQASVADIQSALLWLLGNVSALGRLCRALATTPHDCAPLSPASLVYEAARGGHPTAMGMLLGLCDEHDIGSALSAAIDRDDAPALKVVIEACADDPGLATDAYRRLVCDAMTEAVDAGSLAIVGYLATACDDVTLAEALNRSCADHNDANDIRVFAVLWENAGLCAHAYAASLDPSPALDYLDALIVRGEPCAGPCLACVDDDGKHIDECCRDGDHRSVCADSWP
nr:hypothetical protein [Pandoravirus massiliensis]